MVQPGAPFYRPRPTGLAARLEPRLHDAVSEDAIPYYDEELDVPHSEAHMAMVSDLSGILRALAEELGLKTLSDNPLWIIEPETGLQRVNYPDLALLRPGVDVKRATAVDVLLVGEVVTIERKAKEEKDTRTQRGRFEANEVPEFLLFFPELQDPRALRYHRLDAGAYQGVDIAPGAQVESVAVPGLAFRVLPLDQWKPGRKLEVLFGGEVRGNVAYEHARAELERTRAELERTRAELERTRAQQADARAEQQRTRAEQERSRAEQADARAEQERTRAEQADARAEQERARAEQLRAQLKAAGIDPDDS